MTSEAAPARRHRREERRHAIVEASARLFGRQGFTRTSMRDIATAVGVTEPALYRHFASKQELLDAVIEAREEVRWPEWVEETRGRIPMAEALQQMAVIALRFFEQNGDLTRLILFEALAGDAAALAHHAGVMARWHAHVRALLGGECASRGGDDVSAVADDFVAHLWGVGLQRLLGADPRPLIDDRGEPTARCRTMTARLVARVLAACPTAGAQCAAGTQEQHPGQGVALPRHRHHRATTRPLPFRMSGVTDVPRNRHRRSARHPSRIARSSRRRRSGSAAIWQ